MKAKRSIKTVLLLFTLFQLKYFATTINKCSVILENWSPLIIYNITTQAEDLISYQKEQLLLNIIQHIRPYTRKGQRHIKCGLSAAGSQIKQLFSPYICKLLILNENVKKLLSSISWLRKTNLYKYAMFFVIQCQSSQEFENIVYLNPNFYLVRKRTTCLRLHSLNQHIAKIRIVKNLLTNVLTKKYDGIEKHKIDSFKSNPWKMETTELFRFRTICPSSLFAYVLINSSPVASEIVPSTNVSQSTEKSQKNPKEMYMKPISVEPKVQVSQLSTLSPPEFSTVQSRQIQSVTVFSVAPNPLPTPLPSNPNTVQRLPPPSPLPTTSAPAAPPASRHENKAPIMNTSYDHLKIGRHVFEILRIGMYSNFTTSSLYRELDSSIRIFKATYSSAVLAIAGFYFEARSHSFKCTGCSFTIEPKQWLQHFECTSQVALIRNQWQRGITTLCDHTKHDSSTCFWTQTLTRALSGTGGAAGSSSSDSNESAQTGSRSKLVLSLRDANENYFGQNDQYTSNCVQSQAYMQELEFVNQFTIWLQMAKNNPQLLTNSASRISFAPHEQILSVKFYYLMPQQNTTQSQQPGQPRHPLIKSEAQALIRVVDFKRDQPQDEKQREADKHKGALQRWDSFIAVEVFKMSAEGRKLAYYLCSFWFYVSSVVGSSRPSSSRNASAPELRIACTYCIRAITLRISLENDPEWVFAHICKKHDFRSPTCPRSLGSVADDVPLKTEEKLAILSQIKSMELSSKVPVLLSETQVCFTPPGLFRNVRPNEAALDNSQIAAQKPTVKQEQPDFMRNALQTFVSTAQQITVCTLTEDASEENVDLGAMQQVEQLPETDTLANVNSSLHSQSDSTHYSRELDEETVMNPAHRDLLTALVGLEAPVSPEFANAVLREETFYKWELVSGCAKQQTACLWPHSLPQLSVQRMAAAGFYYSQQLDSTGGSDRVRCFTCGVEVSNWLATDVPVARHVLQSPECHFLLRTVGREKVACELSSGAMTLNLPVVLLEKNPLTVQPVTAQLEQRHVRARRDHEVVRTMTEQFGIPMEIAEILIERQLATKKDDFTHWQELLYFCQSLIEQKPEHLSITEFIENLRRQLQSLSTITAAHPSYSFDTQSIVSHLSGSSAASQDSGRDGSIASGNSESGRSTTSSYTSAASSGIGSSIRSGPSTISLTLASSAVGELLAQSPNLTRYTQQPQSALTLNHPSSSFTSLRSLPHTQELTPTPRDDPTRSPASRFINECNTLSASGSNWSTSTRGSPNRGLNEVLGNAVESGTGAPCRVCQRRKATLIITPCAHRVCPQCAPVAQSLCPVAMCGKVTNSCISVYLA